MPLRGDDPGQWGHSMANMAEIMFPVLETAGVRSLAEIGAYAGDLTAVLLDWAGPVGATVIAVDPMPQQALLDLADERSELELVQETSLDAIPGMVWPDAFIIDGDHNYFTVSEELKAIERRAADATMPLLLFHDVCWPHARRDSYYAPERIPEEYRATIADGVGIAPGEAGITYGGLPYKHVQEREGGERNGVLTAVEDFLEDRPELEFALVPMFFGFGVCWPRNTPYADSIRELTAPLDRNPLIARLEWNRVCSLAESHVARTHHAVLRGEHNQLEDRCRRQEDLLREVEGSRGLRIAEVLSRIRGRSGGMRTRIGAELDSNANDPA